MIDRIRQTFRSRDVPCHGYLYRVQGGAHRRPCVVMAHGFGGTQDGSLARTAQDFAQAGFAVLTFDYRNLGESEGWPRQVISIRGQHEDWHAAIAHARAQPDIDPEKIALWGSSLGGAHVVYVAADDPTVRAVVAQVPFNGFPTKVEGRTFAENWRLLSAAFKDWWRGKTGGEPIYLPAIGTPEDFAVMALEEADTVIQSLQTSTWRNEIAPRVLLDMALWYRPGRKAHRLAMPILACLAEQDKHTPAALARRIADRAPFSELRRYPCTHFEFYAERVRSVVVADQISFLKTHFDGIARP
jgi:dienelactone hydrolase